MRSALRYLRLLRDDPGYFWNVAMKRLRTRLPLDALFLRSGRAFRPVMVMLETTHRCNLRCSMCDLWGKGESIASIRSVREGPEGVLSMEEFSRFIGELRPYGPTFAFGGGEPLLHPRFDEMLEEVKRAGLVATVTTNGTLLEPHARSMVASGLDSLVVSVDGPEEIHDGIRGVKGTFRRLSEGIARLEEEKARRGRVKPRLRLNCTISGRNAARLEEVVDVALRLRAGSLIFSHLWFWDERIVELHNRSLGDFCPTTVQNLGGLEGLDPDTLCAQIERIRKRRRAIAIKFLPDLTPEEIRIYYGSPTRPVKRSRCAFPWLCTFVMPNGDVIPCLDYVVGSLRDAPFPVLWNSERYRQFRMKLRRRGIFPGCVRCCNLYSF